MSPSLVVDIVIALLSLAVFAAAFGYALVATRPVRPRQAPATPDLRDEPPAVVNLLANGWQLNEDAAEATLLDLAARRHLELRQPGDDPMRTTIHLRPPGSGIPGDLTPYEERLLDRVRSLAVDGVVPARALTFRESGQAGAWGRRFRRDVLADAHARGLSRRRFGKSLVTALELVAAVAAVGLAGATLRWELQTIGTDEDLVMWFVAGFLGFTAMSGMIVSVGGERHTEAGLAVAAHWLGVRDWLQRHEEFAALPPAAVMVWDRYLAYGAALGVTRTASDVLSLGMADRTRVWSSYGGTWRQVHVRYPRSGALRAHLGRTIPGVLSGAVLGGLLGVLLVALAVGRLPVLDLLVGFGDEIPADVDWAAVQTALEAITLLAGVFLLARGGYWLVRAAVDLASARILTGEVLWCQPWLVQKRSNSGGSEVTEQSYLAMDDGRGERTTAWALPREQDQRCIPGDTVRIRVRPWTRRVLALTVIDRGKGFALAEVMAAQERADHPTFTQRLAAERADRPTLDVTRLLSPDEVGAALGLPVRVDHVTPTPGMSMATFRSERGKPVLLAQVADDAWGRWFWRMASKRGTEMPGIGDGARTRGNQAITRVGELTIVITLLRAGKGAQSALPRLLGQAAARAGDAVIGPEGAVGGTLGAADGPCAADAGEERGVAADIGAELPGRGLAGAGEAELEGGVAGGRGLSDARP